MQWTSEAIVLEVRAFSESSSLVTVLSEGYGLHNGLFRRGSVNLGDIVEATWTARLPEQLGTWRFELKKSCIAFVMRDVDKIQCFKIFAAVLTEVLFEHLKCLDVYEAARNFINSFSSFYDLSRLDSAGCPGNSPQNELQRLLWNLLFVELALLPRVGVVLDFKDLVKASKHDPLEFVSPRTGRIVTRSMGEPYKDKLLAFPSLFLEDKEAEAEASGQNVFQLFNKRSLEDLRKMFSLTHYFLFKSPNKSRTGNTISDFHRASLAALLDTLP
ncbi:MAG: recombination protein O N-terminal domain-containing protein [Holosporales bacterium]|jgi:DNA repair protein RecO (recombination protein O)|nr:recombination protein O N-terminal domain-containing protein [Holosporales bacterium]